MKRWMVSLVFLTGCASPGLQEMPATFAIQARRVEASSSPWNLHLIRSEGTEAIQGAEDVVIAVVDTGVDAHHPQLQGRLLPMIDRVGTDRFWWNDKAYDYTGTDGNGHGTHVCGIVSSVLGRSKVWILPVKSIPHTGIGDDRAIASGIRAAVDYRDPAHPSRRVRAINLSVGGKTKSKSMQEALEYAQSRDVLLVVSAGNDGIGVSYPASAPGVMAVASTNRWDQLANYSNHGPELSLAAPGGDDAEPVESTWPTYLTASDHKKGLTLAHSTQGMIGTSMAAPHVSGVAGLLFANTPGLNNRSIRTRLEAWTTDLGPVGPDAYFGAGRLNQAQALSKVAHDANR